MNITVTFDGSDDPNLPDGTRLAFYGVEAYEVSTPADIMQTDCSGAGCDGCSAAHHKFTGTARLELKVTGQREGGPRWEFPEVTG